MIKVTYKAEYPVKEGRKWITKTNQWEEVIKTESDAKLRALALGWQIVKIDPTEGAGT